MSFYHNNSLIHNLRTAARMVEEGMPPHVVAASYKSAGIVFPEDLVAAISRPGVVDDISVKPITHALADRHIHVYTNTFLPAMTQAQGIADDMETVYDDEDLTEQDDDEADAHWASIEATEAQHHIRDEDTGDEEDPNGSM